MPPSQRATVSSSGSAQRVRPATANRKTSPMSRPYSSLIAATASQSRSATTRGPAGPAPASASMAPVRVGSPVSSSVPGSAAGDDAARGCAGRRAGIPSRRGGSGLHLADDHRCARADDDADHDRDGVVEVLAVGGRGRHRRRHQCGRRHDAGERCPGEHRREHRHRGHEGNADRRLVGRPAQDQPAPRGRGAGATRPRMISARRLTLMCTPHGRPTSRPPSLGGHGRRGTAESARALAGCRDDHDRPSASRGRPSSWRVAPGSGWGAATRPRSRCPAGRSSTT